MWVRGTWGVFWRSAHVPAIPFMWLHRVQALGSTAHASPLHAGIKLLRVHVLFPMGSREFLCPNMGIVTSMWSHGRYDWFWLVKTKCAALWLATTTLSLMYYLHELCSASNLRAIEKRWKTSVQVDSQSHISHYHELMMLCLACQLIPNRLISSQFMRNRIPCQRDAGTRLAMALRKRRFSECSKGNSLRLQSVVCSLHAGKLYIESTKNEFVYSLWVIKWLYRECQLSLRLRLRN